MNGVVIEPARPPVPRLSVLPATIRVARVLTAPPSAMVSVPTSGPQPAIDIADGECAGVQDRAGAGDRQCRAAIGGVADGHEGGVDDGAAGDREPADPAGASASDLQPLAADVPGRPRAGHGRPRDAEERIDLGPALAV